MIRRQLKYFIAILLILKSVSSLKIDKAVSISTVKKVVAQKGDPQYQNQNSITNFQLTWFNTEFGSANDIGVGSEGDVYVVGMDGKLYMYNFLANSYVIVEGNFELSSISRVDVDSNGTPYVVLSCGDTYYLDCNNKWVQLPGCAIDIGVGRGGEIWKIGCDERQGGYGIWKLFCKSKCQCDSERSCTRFRQFHYSSNHNSEDKKCYWYRIEGGAARVDVHPNGYPWVVTNDGIVYSYDGINWTRINGVLGNDITVSNDGMTLVAGKDSVIYSLQNPDTSQWVSLAGSSAIDISAGPFSQPWVVAISKNVYTTAKFDYN